MTKTKNIVIVNDFSYIQGGASRIAIDTANILNEAGYCVYFFTGDSKDASSLNNNIKIISTNQGESLNEKNRLKGAINNLYNISAKKELKKLLRTLNPNETIVHYHGWTKCLSSSVFSAAYELKFKTVVTLHDYFLVCPNGAFYDSKKHQTAELKPWQYLFRNCDSRNYLFQLFRLLRFFIQNNLVKVPQKTTSLIAVSNFSKKIIAKNLKINPPITLLYNPVLSTTAPKRKSRKNYYLYVGRLSEEKGINIFCQTISEIHKKGIVVGDGETNSKLQALYPNIQFVGWKKHDEVEAYLNEAKALIFPSVTYETMGITVVEALRHKTPCIVNKNTAASEFIIDGKNGILYDNLLDGITRFELNKDYDFTEQKLDHFDKNYYRNHLIKIYDKSFYKK